MATDFHFTRLQDTQKLRSDDLSKTLGAAAVRGETWLVVSPHDDDACVGAGLWMQAAVSAGVNLVALVVTDGRMGYCTLQQRDRIVQIRRDETIESFGILGVPEKNVYYIGYPDGSLSLYGGRRRANPDETDIAGYIGLQNAYTYYLRKFRPQRVLVCTPTDLHPDHQATHNELMISLFHAQGDIWPELGEPLAKVPALYEMAIYCDFSSPPNLEVRASEQAFDVKLRSIAAYRSQLQIASVVESIRRAGAYEYLREVEFRLYSSQTYRGLFA